MPTSRNDAEINCDSSFEVVEKDELLELSESFQSVTNDDTIPITTSILGKWKPISYENLEEYHELQKTPKDNQIAGETSAMIYIEKNGLIHAYSEHNNKIRTTIVYNIGVHITKDNESTVTQVENNSLNTICVNLSDGKEKWRVERFVKNGSLIVVNHDGEAKCERIFKRA